MNMQFKFASVAVMVAGLMLSTSAITMKSATFTSPPGSTRCRSRRSTSTSGSANAATVMDLLSAIEPEAALFLGKCGGLKNKPAVGDFILPIAAIRGEGTSNDYFPPEVPALPAFNLQKAVSSTIRDNNQDYWTGTVYSTNRRVWEHDEDFKAYLRRIRAMAIDMETATIFSTGFFNKIPTGALLLVSDQPMTPAGIKTARSDSAVTEKFSRLHLRIGIDSLKKIINDDLSVKHLKF